MDDAIIEAERVAEAWGEPAVVYTAVVHDGTHGWAVHDVTTATGYEAMGIDQSRVVAMRVPSEWITSGIEPELVATA